MDKLAPSVLKCQHFPRITCASLPQDIPQKESLIVKQNCCLKMIYECEEGNVFVLVKPRASHLPVLGSVSMYLHSSVLIPQLHTKDLFLNLAARLHYHWKRKIRKNRERKKKGCHMRMTPGAEFFSPYFVFSFE